MSRLAALDPLTLNQMRAAGLSDLQIERYLQHEDQVEMTRAAAVGQARADAGRPRTTVAVAMRALSGAGAPHSLVRAYVEACARPSRIVRDVVTNVGRDVKLSAAAATKLHKQIDHRPTVASIWAQIHASAAEVQT